MNHPSETNDSSASGAPSNRPSRAPSTRLTIVVLAFGALALGYEYRATILSSALFVWLPLLLCVGRHFFMHGGHGSHRDSGQDDDR